MKTIRAAIIAIIALAVGPFCAFGLGPNCDKVFNEIRRLPRHDHACWKQDIDFLVEWGKHIHPPIPSTITQYPPEYFTIQPYGVPAQNDDAFWDMVSRERPLFGK